ncbi:MAG: hypothetical protein FWD94_07005 [Treponema sp.]|nr:hypothetical protein [Treponema sp.]
MAATDKYRAPEGLTVEQFWEMFYAKIAENEERNKEYERKRAEEKAEFDRKWAGMVENWERADRRIQEANRQVGGISNTFGEVIEHLVLPGIEDRFAEMGLRFSQVSPRRKLKDSAGRVVAEIDLLLENKDTIVAVETKGKPSVKDIESHGGKLEKLREWLGETGDRRRILGAVAGAVFGSGERLAALKTGFYVVVQSGDTMRMDVPEGFEPKVW